MYKELFLQLHVHSSRSHDSSTPICEYVSYLDNLAIDFGCALLGVTDHNVVPISMEQALEYSTKRVVVIPGIQWRVRQNIPERLAKRSTRREILTLGDHDDFNCYITGETQYRIEENEEIIGHFEEHELLCYLASNPDIVLVVPHPKHFIVDYYGPSEIRDLRKKIESKGITAPFFVEVKTGCDPFPRIFSTYDDEYCVIGGSDAHQVKSPFGTESVLSVKTTIPVESAFLKSLEETIEKRELVSFKKLVKDILFILKRNNRQIAIEKHYGRAVAQFVGTIPCWVRRRFDDFPRNFFK